MARNLKLCHNKEDVWVHSGKNANYTLKRFLPVKMDFFVKIRLENKSYLGKYYG